MELSKVVRPSVTRFARHMEAQLLRNDGRGGWHNCSPDYLIEALERNLADLKSHWPPRDYSDSTQRTCADLGNFAMMLSENTAIEANAEIMSPEKHGASKETCPACGSPEVEANTPRTTYACGSNDYDQRPGTFKQGKHCKVKPAPISARKEAKG